MEECTTEAELDFLSKKLAVLSDALQNHNTSGLLAATPKAGPRQQTANTAIQKPSCYPADTQIQNRYSSCYPADTNKPVTLSDIFRLSADAIKQQQTSAIMQPSLLSNISMPPPEPILQPSQLLSNISMPPPEPIQSPPAANSTEPIIGIMPTPKERPKPPKPSRSERLPPPEPIQSPAANSTKPKPPPKSSLPPPEPTNAPKIRMLSVSKTMPKKPPQTLYRVDKPPKKKKARHESVTGPSPPPCAPPHYLINASKYKRGPTPPAYDLQDLVSICAQHTR